MTVKKNSSAILNISTSASPIVRPLNNHLLSTDNTPGRIRTRTSNGLKVRNATVTPRGQR